MTVIEIIAPGKASKDQVDHLESILRERYPKGSIDGSISFLKSFDSEIGCEAKDAWHKLFLADKLRIRISPFQPAGLRSPAVLWYWNK